MAECSLPGALSSFAIKICERSWIGCWIWFEGNATSPPIVWSNSALPTLNLLRWFLYVSSSFLWLSRGKEFYKCFSTSIASSTSTLKTSRAWPWRRSNQMWWMTHFKQPVSHPYNSDDICIHPLKFGRCDRG